MSLQTLSNKAGTISAKQPARHQRFAASPLARMRHSKGFTLVELMVVIVIVGILSAVALPKFLGVKDKAKLNTQLGEAAGLAKECSAAIIAEGTYPADYGTGATTTTNTGLTIAGNCNGGGTTPTATAPATDGFITYTTTAASASSGAKCGSLALDATKQCKVSVDTDNGDISYAQV